MNLWSTWNNIVLRPFKTTLALPSIDLRSTDRSASRTDSKTEDNSYYNTGLCYETNPTPDRLAKISSVELYTQHSNW